MRKGNDLDGHSACFALAGFEHQCAEAQAEQAQRRGLRRLRSGSNGRSSDDKIGSIQIRVTGFCIIGIAIFR